MKSSGASDLHVLLLRHGQTDSNAGGVLQGHLPIPLNGLGHRQAGQLARRLAGYVPRVERLLTSDLRRATETAAPIERALGLTADRDEAWRERAFGSYEGRTVGDTEIWRAATGTLDPPGAEPIDQMSIRVEDALQSLVARADSATCIAVVTHGGVMRTALSLLADHHLPLAPGHAAVVVGPILNASILHLAVGRTDPIGVWRVVSVNDVEHLRHADVTARDAG
jgi:broad specificity phosphatase PhoE